MTLNMTSFTQIILHPHHLSIQPDPYRHVIYLPHLPKEQVLVKGMALMHICWADAFFIDSVYMYRVQDNLP